MKTILLSLLFLQGCVSVSLAEPAEPLVITVSTPIIKSALDHVVYLSPEYPTLEMYKELEARVKALEENSFIRLPPNNAILMPPYMPDQHGTIITTETFKLRSTLQWSCTAYHGDGICDWNK